MIVKYSAKAIDMDIDNADMEAEYVKDLMNSPFDKTSFQNSNVKPLLAMPTIPKLYRTAQVKAAATGRTANTKNNPRLNLF